ncbi:MAG: 6-bladed beta-propeller [Bacteroidota bacterium]
MKFINEMGTLLALGVVMLTSTQCSNNKDTQEGHKTIKVEFRETANLSDLIEPDFTYLPLGSDSINLIGSVNRLIFRNDKIYVLDQSGSKKFFCFDKQGNVQFVGGNVGDGPGEYAHLEDFLVTNDEIIVNDNGSQSWLYYDVNGEFQSEKNVGLWIEEFIPFGENEILIYTPSDYIKNEAHANLPPNILKVVDSDFVVKAGFLPYLEVIDDAAVPGVLGYFDNRYSFSRSVLGEIYSLDPDYQFKKRYQIDFGPYNWPFDAETIQKDQSKTEEVFLKGGVMTLTHRLLENEQFFTFQSYKLDAAKEGSYEEEDKWWCIYDKSKDVCYAFHEVINDIDGGSFSFPRAKDGENFVSAIDAEFLILANGETNDLEKKETLDQLKGNLVDGSNPVLMFFRLKDEISL